MDQERITYLCSRYLNSASTTEELLEFEFLLQDRESEQVLEDLFNEAYYKMPANLQQYLSREKADLIFDRIVASEEQSRGVLNWWKKAWFAAAAVLIIAGSSLFLMHKPQIKNQITNMDRHMITPGQEAATLTLSDGRLFRLTKNSLERRVVDAGMIITNTRDGGVVYKKPSRSFEYNAEPDRNTHHTLTTNLGESYMLQLSDSTRIWLDAGSTITYPVSFVGKGVREVTIEGEAYFEVRKMKTPFIVNTDAQKIKVTGTSFNVRCYPDESKEVTTVVEGAVIVYSDKNRIKKLLQGERIVVSQTAFDLDRKDHRADIAWQNRLFFFDDASIPEVMTALSRWYNFEVVYEGEIPQETFYGLLSRNQKLENVLRILEETKLIRFRIEGRRVIVMS